MMKTPRDRAVLITSFIGPASSPTRRAADLHQWSSHMSQMMMAVFLGSQADFLATVVYPSGSAFDWNRCRSVSCKAAGCAMAWMGRITRIAANADRIRKRQARRMRHSPLRQQALYFVNICRGGICLSLDE